MEIKTDQITELLKKQLEKYDNDIDVSEVGEIIEVGDGGSKGFRPRKRNEFRIG